MKLLIYIFCICPFILSAQNKMDSLWGIWQDHSMSDSIRIRALGKYTFYGQLFTHPDSGYKYAQIQLEFSKEANNIWGQADALNTQGASFFLKGDYDQAIVHFDKSLNLYKKINDIEGIGNVLNNISGVCVTIESYDKAIQYLREGLSYFLEADYEIGIAMTYTNIGTVYYYKSKQEETDEHKIRFSDSAYQWLHLGLNHSSNINYPVSKSNALGNLGLVHLNTERFDSSEYYLKQSISLKKRLGNLEGTGEDLIHLSNLHTKTGELSKAIEYGDSALVIAEQINAQQLIRDASKCLYEIYKQLMKPKEALAMFEQYVAFSDSISSEENKKEIIRQEYKYEYEKQAAADSVKAVQAAKIKDAELAAERAENKRQRIIIYFIIALVVVILFFVYMVLKSLRLVKLEKARVDSAYEQLDEKNTEILDSINYAKRIQSAILPPQKVVKEYLPESFILYKPKDIVAGDFYWLDHVENKVLFAACDCTGHGVPGAMVSVLCNNGLNRSVREYGLTDPGKILDRTREIVISEFEKSEDEVKDGMDIALCSLEEKTLKYAGAHNPLWIIRNGSNEVEEIKADKQPIGQYSAPLPYTTHSIQLHFGDTIYIFSDGYVDQFGGERGKKFKAANFKKLLLSIQEESMQKQREIINQKFNHWKGEIEQLDDVCVIGVRI